MIVMKFGGTSVKDSSAINNLVRIVKSRVDKKPIIVCSAISEMTDTLFKLGTKAGTGNIEECDRLIESIRKRHIQITEESFRDSDEKQITQGKINGSIRELCNIIRGIQLLGELSDRSIARILSFGEILSTTIIADILNYNNIKSKWTDARKFIKTKGDFISAEPEFDLIKEKTPLCLNPVLEKGSVVVTQGFIGSDSNCVTTVFSRGGSDFSASLIGMAMNAEEVEIWTDTNGILTADPKCIANPLTVKEISFNEASELAFFGAKVLHPSTIAPVIEKNIPVRILNSQNPEFTGTLISNKKNIHQPPFKSITSKTNVTLLSICNPKLLPAYEFLKKIFEVFDTYQIAADLITISKDNVSITLDERRYLNEIVKDLRLFSEVKVDSEKSQVSLVGSNPRNFKNIEAQIFEAVGVCNVTMISKVVSSTNFSFVTEQADLDSVIQSLHKSFFED